MAGKGFGIRLGGKQNIVRIGTPCGPSRLPLHLRRIAFEERRTIKIVVQLRGFQFPGQSPLIGCPRVTQAIQMRVSRNQVGVGQSRLRVQSDSLEEFITLFVVLAQVSVNDPQVVVGHVVPRIFLSPLFIGLARFVQISGIETVIVSRNHELFLLAYPVDQVISFLEILVCRAILLQVPISESQCHIGHRKIGVQLNGLLKERNRGIKVACVQFLVSLRVVAKGFGGG